MEASARLAVIGCGRMGRGIAGLAAAAGLEVFAASSRPGMRANVQSRFDAERERLSERKGAEAVAHYARINVVDRVEELADCDVIIESIVEDLETKQALLASLSQLSPRAILGTNTSSLTLRELASSVQAPERFVGLHFFNPPSKMKLVELARCERTSEDTMARAEAFCRELGQSPIRVQGVPGYIVNRLLVPQLLHAIETLSAGVADIEAIDEALKLGASHPMGPLALADYIGLDIVQAMAQAMRSALDDPRFDTPPLLTRMVEEGLLGRKSGTGFYRYEGRSATPNGALRP